MMLKEVREHNTRLRGWLKEKHKKKVNHLVRKFGEMTKPEVVWGDVKKGFPGIFDDKKNFWREGLRNLLLWWDLVRILFWVSLKFCLYKKLCDEEFEVGVEECILQIKWDMTSDEERTSPGTDDKPWKYC